MRSLIAIIEKLTQWLSGIVQGWVVFMMMALVLTDVTTRYVLQNPLSIAEEYGGYMLVLVTCMGLAFAWKERSHVRVEFLLNKLPVSCRRGLRLATLLVALVFTGFMVVAGYELVSFSFMFGTRSGSWLRTPVAWPQMAIVVGAGLMFLQLFAEILKALINSHPARKEDI